MCLAFIYFDLTSGDEMFKELNILRNKCSYYIKLVMNSLLSVCVMVPLERGVQQRLQRAVFGCADCNTTHC